MRTVFLFIVVSLDGFFEGPDHELDWHIVDDEFNEFALQQLNDVDTILFGRRTYQLMASYWPTQAGREDEPHIADKMNSLPKIVFSTTLETADWSNTRLIKHNALEEVSKLKEQPGKDVAIFGSSDLTVSLLKRGLVDEVRVVISPVVLGSGRLLFDGIGEKVNLRLLRTRTFGSGNVLFCYQPIMKSHK